jgi:prevent-host-death family protein
LEAPVPTTTLTSREYNRNRSLADKALRKGPVIVTDRGRPTKVILSFGEYEQLAGSKKDIVDLLTMPGLEGIEFNPPRLGDESLAIPDLD